MRDASGAPPPLENKGPVFAARRKLCAAAPLGTKASPCSFTVSSARELYGPCSPLSCVVFLSGICGYQQHKHSFTLSSDWEIMTLKPMLTELT